MMKIKKGDFILHNQSGKVVAISVARDNYKIVDRLVSLIRVKLPTYGIKKDNLSN